jgi:hypothetical protein
MRHSVRSQQRKRFRTPTRKVASELAGLSHQQTWLGTASEAAKFPPRNDHTRPGGEVVLNIGSLFAAVGLLTVAALSQLPNSSKAQDENELRKIESETAKFEQQNDSSIMGLLADDWVYRGARVLTKSEFGGKCEAEFCHPQPWPQPIHHREEEHASRLVSRHRRRDLYQGVSSASRYDAVL